MSTRKNNDTVNSNVTTTTSTNNTENTIMNPTITNPSSTAVTPVTASTPDPNPMPMSVVFLQPPPPGLVIPPQPPGFVPVKGGFARNIKPRKTEAVAMPGAVQELKSFVDYSAVFGGLAPSQDEMTQTFDAASQWTVMRIASKGWGVYSANEEGIAWTAARDLMARMKPAFDLAVQSNPGLAAKYPKLATVLGAKSAIAKKAGATRTTNKKLVAAGEAPTQGAKAKKQAKAEKVAAAVNAAAATVAAEGTQQKPAAEAHTASPAPAPAVTPAPAATAVNGTSGNAHS